MRTDCFDQQGRILLSKVFLPAFQHGLFINGNHVRYRIYKGARNTGKSKNIIGYESIIKILSDPRRNIVMVRLNANSNKQSTYENICGCIFDLGLEGYFRMRENPSPEIEYKPTGQKILFKGMNDPTTLNSITFAHGYLTDVYIEEAFEHESYTDFRKLDGSLRTTPKDLPLQITLCFNAWSKESWIYERFCKDVFEDDVDYLDNPSNAYEDYCDPDWQGDFGKGLYIHTSTYKTNVFRDPDWDAAAEMTKKRSRDIYNVEFLGMWGNSTASTYPEFKDSCIMSLADIEKKFHFRSFTLGIDTGLSNGEGGRRTVGKNQKVEERIKAATAVELCGITDDSENIVILDEYYHTEIERNGVYNTDTPYSIGEPKILSNVADTVLFWMRKYGSTNIGVFDGDITNIYVDSGDVGFAQMLQKEFQTRGVWNVYVYNSGKKLTVQTRVDFEKIMFAWGNFIICDQCKNAIRELRNARRDAKGRAREDLDDHAITAFEYGYTPMLGDVRMWKRFKQH